MYSLNSDIINIKTLSNEENPFSKRILKINLKRVKPAKRSSSKQENSSNSSQEIILTFDDLRLICGSTTTSLTPQNSIQNPSFWIFSCNNITFNSLGCYPELPLKTFINIIQFVNFSFDYCLCKLHSIMELLRKLVSHRKSEFQR